MIDGEPGLEPLHPGPVEFEQYLRGRLAPGHAAALLAHAVGCRLCAAALSVATERFMGGLGPVPPPTTSRLLLAR